MSCRKAIWLTRLCMLLSAVLAVLVFLPADMLPVSGSIVMIGCILSLIVGLAIYIINYRCPHCGTSLSMSEKFTLILPEKCPHCDGKLK